MTKIIAISNQKGGVAKTTTTHALAAGLADKGYKVLAIDLDPQGNLSAATGIDNYTKPTMYELMKQSVAVDDVIQASDGGFDVIPANITLAAAEQEFSQIGKEYLVKEVVSPIVGRYDYILLDTPPSLGMLTINAFSFAADVIIPTTAGIFATTGIKQLNDTVERVRKYCNPNLAIRGILFTRFNPRTNISKQIRELTEQLGEFISAPVYKTYIRTSVAVEEAQAKREDIFDYAGKSTVAEDYKAFIEEFLEGDMNNDKEE